jgi:hypothetical protein
LDFQSALSGRGARFFRLSFDLGSHGEKSVNAKGPIDTPEASAHGGAMIRARFIAMLLPALLLGQPVQAGGVPKEETLRLMIGEADRLKRPVDQSLLTKHDSERDIDELEVRLDNPELAKNEDLKKGFTVTLLGGAEKPVALVFYIDSFVGQYYLIPFEGVREIDCERRMAKVSERIYSVLSNRSNQGVFTKKLSEVR